MRSSNDGIVSALTERLAAKKPLQAHPTTFQRTVFLNGLPRVFRTRRLEPACGRQERRNRRLINPQQIKNQKLHLSNAEARTLVRDYLPTSLRIAVRLGSLRNAADDLSKLCERPFQFRPQQTSPRIQHPIVFRRHGVKLDLAQPECLSQKSLGPISVMRLADRLLRRRNTNPMDISPVGQKKDRHKTAFDAKTLLVNTKKLGALSEPSFLR